MGHCARIAALRRRELPFRSCIFRRAMAIRALELNSPVRSLDALQVQRVVECDCARVAPSIAQGLEFRMLRRKRAYGLELSHTVPVALHAVSCRNSLQIRRPGVLSVT